MTQPQKNTTSYELPDTYTQEEKSIIIGALLGHVTANPAYAALPPHPVYGSQPLSMALLGLSQAYVRMVGELIGIVGWSAGTCATLVGTHVHIALPDDEEQLCLNTDFLSLVVNDDGVTDLFLTFAKSCATALNEGAAPAAVIQGIVDGSVEAMRTNGHIAGQLLLPLLQRAYTGMPLSVGRGLMQSFLEMDEAPQAA